MRNPIDFLTQASDPELRALDITELWNIYVKATKLLGLAAKSCFVNPSAKLGEEILNNSERINAKLKLLLQFNNLPYENALDSLALEQQGLVFPEYVTMLKLKELYPISETALEQIARASYNSSNHNYFAKFIASYHYVASACLIKQLIENQDSIKYAWDNIITKPINYFIDDEVNNIIARPFEGLVDNKTLMIIGEKTLNINIFLHLYMNLTFFFTMRLTSAPEETELHPALSTMMQFKIMLMKVETFSIIDTGFFVARQYLSEASPFAYFGISAIKLAYSYKFLEGSLFNKSVITPILAGTALSALSFGADITSSYIKGNTDNHYEYGVYDIAIVGAAIFIGMRSAKDVKFTTTLSLVNAYKALAILHTINFSHKILEIPRVGVPLVCGKIKDNTITFGVWIGDKYEAISQKTKIAAQSLSQSVTDAFIRIYNNQPDDVEAIHMQKPEYVLQCINADSEFCLNTLASHFYSCSDHMID